MNIRLEVSLKGLVIAVWGMIDGVRHEAHPEFRGHLAGVCDKLRDRYQDQAPSEIEQLASARELYRSVGMDPTRHRPSSEALLRRVVAGKGLYLLDPLVDTCNLFSMASGLPLGLYDRDFLGDIVTLRLGTEGEGYEGIRKGRVNVTSRFCLADEQGAFGSPSSDSFRARIRKSTSNILYLLYAPASTDSNWLREQGELLTGSFLKWNGGKEIARGELK
jgi:DNA/RNA-binding domain of Phe-tRNA-synthetase-like protein